MPLPLPLPYTSVVMKKRNLSIIRELIYKAVQKAGFDIIDSHHELESNTKMRAEMERMGGQLYKRYRIFKKNLL